MAARQVCRKLDMFWSDDAFDFVEKKNTYKTMMSAYIYKINSGNYVGKSYDDTLSLEGTLWDFSDSAERNGRRPISQANSDDTTKYDVLEIDIPDDVIAFWGPSYTPDMYLELEQRREYWMTKLPKEIVFDAGTEALIRQICSLEIDINRDRADGKQVDKLVNTLNNLLGSAQLKPTQKADSAKGANASTPFGVWIKRFEDERPIPEVDPSLRDVDGIKKYISVWLLGHLAKMLGLKKAELKLYEEEIEKLRVERPEYDDEDDEEVFNDFFSEIGDESYEE